MKHPLSLIVFILFSSTIHAAEQKQLPEKSSPPNVVFILADDLGYGDLGCFGCTDIKTPRLDRLADDGVRLTQHYAGSPVCSPTRAALLTGRYTQRAGLDWAVWYQTPNEGLPPDEVTLAELLRDRAGYQTAMAGKWHLGYNVGWRPRQQGFERFFGCLGGNVNYFRHNDKLNTHDIFFGDKPIHRDGEYMTDLIGEYAIRFLNEMKDGPFFLYVPFNAPHFPYQGPDDADKPFAWDKGTRAENYRPIVERMDYQIGRILDELKELKLDENTIVVFTSDNGGCRLASNAPFSGMKGTCLEGGLRVPCVVRWPNRLKPGATMDQPCHIVDWAATFLARAGAEPSKDRPLDGVDIMPALEHGERIADRSLFWRFRDPWRKPNRPARLAVRHGDWKYIEGQEEQPQLFNLTDDPTEQHNLLASHPAEAARLKAELDAWQRDVDSTPYDQYNAALKKRADSKKKKHAKHPQSSPISVVPK